MEGDYILLFKNERRRPTYEYYAPKELLRSLVADGWNAEAEEEADGQEYLETSMAMLASHGGTSTIPRNFRMVD